MREVIVLLLAGLALNTTSVSIVPDENLDQCAPEALEQPSGADFSMIPRTHEFPYSDQVVVLGCRLSETGRLEACATARYGAPQGGTWTAETAESWVLAAVERFRFATVDCRGQSAIGQPVARVFRFDFSDLDVTADASASPVPAALITLPQVATSDSPWCVEPGVEPVRPADVQLLCLATRAGQADCVVAREEPLGWGYGNCALELANDIEVALTDNEGLPTAGRTFRLRVRANQ